METRRLKYFVRIAEDGSLMKASGVLRIAQPALSRQLRLLEEELGVPLFRRSSRGMQLTEQGEQLRAAIAGPLRELEMALQTIRSGATSAVGNIAIGMPPSIGDVVSAPLALRISEELPNIKLRLVEGVTGSLMDWLLRGMVDFALLEHEPEDARLSNRELCTEPLLLVGAASSALSLQRSMPFKEVVRLPLIVPSHHLGLRNVLNTAASKARKNLNIAFEADSVRLMKELVDHGMGFTVLPRTYFKAEWAGGRLKCCTITQPSLSLTTYLSRRNYQPSNPGIAHVIEDRIAELFAASRS